MKLSGENVAFIYVYIYAFIYLYIFFFNSNFLYKGRTQSHKNICPVVGPQGRQIMANTVYLF